MGSASQHFRPGHSLTQLALQTLIYLQMVRNTLQHQAALVSKLCFCGIRSDTLCFPICFLGIGVPWWVWHGSHHTVSEAPAKPLFGFFTWLLILETPRTPTARVHPENALECVQLITPPNCSLHLEPFVLSVCCTYPGSHSIAQRERFQKVQKTTGMKNYRFYSAGKWFIDAESFRLYLKRKEKNKKPKNNNPLSHETVRWGSYSSFWCSFVPDSKLKRLGKKLSNLVKSNLILDFTQGCTSQAKGT